MGFILEVIKKIWCWFKELKPQIFMQKIWDFFFAPKSFWHFFSKASLEDKWRQFGVYSFIYILFFYICFGIGKESDFIQYSIIEIGGLGVFILIAELSIVIGNQRVKKEEILKVFLFCYYLFVLVAPIAYVSLLVYVRMGSMVALAFLLILQILIEIYLLVGPAILFAKKKKNSWYMFLSAIALISICDIVYPYMSIDNGQDKIIPDLVSKERHELGLSIKMPYTIPIAVVSYYNGTRLYLYASPYDSIATIKNFTDDEYFNVLQQDIDSLRVISERTKYRFNSMFFSDLMSVKLAVQQISMQKEYMVNPVEKVICCKSEDGKTVTMGDIRFYNMEIYEELIRILNRDIEATSVYSKILNVYYVRYVYRPVFLYRTILEYLNNEVEE